MQGVNHAQTRAATDFFNSLLGFRSRYQAGDLPDPVIVVILTRRQRNRTIVPVHGVGIVLEVIDLFVHPIVTFVIGFAHPGLLFAHPEDNRQRPPLFQSDEDRAEWSRRTVHPGRG